VQTLPDTASLSDQWSTGIGGPIPSSLFGVTSTLSLIQNVLIANVFQLPLSLAYITFNGLFTCILLSREFASYAHKRHGLRVTNASGKYQRSSYWLTVPYRFSIPLVVLSALLHWMQSQTIVLVEVNVLEPNGTFTDDDAVHSLGYSTLALLITLIIWTVMICSLLALGWTTYFPGAPLVESSSLAISAACHTPSGDFSEPNQLLKYGVIGKSSGCERVCLTSGPVGALEHGSRYSILEELDATDLKNMSLPNLNLALIRIASIFLALFALARFSMLMVLLLYAVSYFYQFSLYGIFIIVSVSVVSIAYIFVRMVFSIIRWYIGWKLQVLVWHVVLDSLFT
jgi:hypothetical protein